jgi:hypothetical protein
MTVSHQRRAQHHTAAAIDPVADDVTAASTMISGTSVVRFKSLGGN